MISTVHGIQARLSPWPPLNFNGLSVCAPSVCALSVCALLPARAGAFLSQFGGLLSCACQEMTAIESRPFMLSGLPSPFCGLFRKGWYMV